MLSTWLAFNVGYTIAFGSNKSSSSEGKSLNFALHFWQRIEAVRQLVVHNFHNFHNFTASPMIFTKILH